MKVCACVRLGRGRMSARALPWRSVRGKERKRAAGWREQNRGKKEHCTTKKSERGKNSVDARVSGRGGRRGTSVGRESIRSV